ncbi:MAG: hypothetical protein IBJ00_06485 [Alphaproteobacteria bacterium]|nr:hypothetical protein [Alphaproteobacteria bacterium]
MALILTWICLIIWGSFCFASSPYESQEHGLSHSETFLKQANLPTHILHEDMDQEDQEIFLASSPYESPEQGLSDLEISLSQANLPTDISHEDMNQADQKIFLNLTYDESNPADRITKDNVLEKNYELRSFLKSQKDITAISFQGHEMGDKGAWLLSGTLKDFPSITSLDFSKNKIGNKSALSLSKLTHLTSLDVSHNQINNEGALALLEGFKSSTTLISLNLEHNPIKEDTKLRDLLNGLKGKVSISGLEEKSPVKLRESQSSLASNPEQDLSACLQGLSSYGQRLCETPELENASEYFKLFYKLMPQRDNLFKFMTAFIETEIETIDEDTALQYLMVYTYFYGKEGQKTRFREGELEIVKRLETIAGVKGVAFVSKYIDKTPLQIRQFRARPEATSVEPVTDMQFAPDLLPSNLIYNTNEEEGGFTSKEETPYKEEFEAGKESTYLNIHTEFSQFEGNEPTPSILKEGEEVPIFPEEES